MSAKPLSADRPAKPLLTATEGGVIQACILGEYISTRVQSPVGNIIHISRGCLLWIPRTARDTPVAQAPYCSTQLMSQFRVTFVNLCHTTLYPSHTCIINIEHLFPLSCISFVKINIVFFFSLFPLSESMCIFHCFCLLWPFHFSGWNYQPSIVLLSLRTSRRELLLDGPCFSSFASLVNSSTWKVSFISF